MSSDRIPLCAPRLAGNEWRYIKECLDTGWVSSVGSYVDRFERALAERIGAAKAVACASGTAALHLGLLVAGVRPGDEVVLPTVTFIAPANAVRYLSAWPVLIDAEPRYFQMDVSKLAGFLRDGCKFEGGELRNKATGRRVSAILPVHVLGHPCDMDPIMELAGAYGLPVVEDATESLGSTYKSRATGRLATVGCFSFNGNKIITTGSGGMLVSDDVTLASHAKHLSTQAKQDPIEFVHDEVGYNYRLSNISAAFGVAQLEELDAFVVRKRSIAATYDLSFSAVAGIGTPQVAEGVGWNAWLYTIRVDAEAFDGGSRGLMRRLAAEQIESRPLWQPMHHSPAHRDAFAWQCTMADAIHGAALSIPCSVGLTEAQQQRVIDVILAARR